MDKEPKPNDLNAFPDPMRGADQSYTNQYPDSLDKGMSLRDYFAAKALPIVNFDVKDNYGNTRWDIGARQAYLIADAMLKEREK